MPQGSSMRRSEIPRICCTVHLLAWIVFPIFPWTKNGDHVYHSRHYASCMHISEIRIFCLLMMCQLVRAFCQQTDAEVSNDECDAESLMLVYQLQAEQFKEDFEHERQDHHRTKAQVQSLTTQWRNLYDELRLCQDKVRCPVDWYGLTTVTVPHFCKWGSQTFSRRQGRARFFAPCVALNT